LKEKKNIWRNFCIDEKYWVRVNWCQFLEKFFLSGLDYEGKVVSVYFFRRLIGPKFWL